MSGRMGIYTARSTEYCSPSIQPHCNSPAYVVIGIGPKYLDHYSTLCTRIYSANKWASAENYYNWEVNSLGHAGSMRKFLVPHDFPSIFPFSLLCLFCWGFRPEKAPRKSRPLVRNETRTQMCSPPKSLTRNPGITQRASVGGATTP